MPADRKSQPEPNPAIALMARLAAKFESSLAALPDAAEVREIYHAAAIEVAEKESNWLAAPEAARHCGWSLRSFRRKRSELGIPFSEIDGLQRYYRADLDAVIARHIVQEAGAQVINFPSIALRDAAIASSAA